MGGAYPRPSPVLRFGPRSRSRPLVQTWSRPGPDLPEAGWPWRAQGGPDLVLEAWGAVRARLLALNYKICKKLLAWTCMCDLHVSDNNDTRPSIALEPRWPTPTGAHTSSIGPRTAIVGGWKPPHGSMTAGRWIFVPVLSHFAKRTKFWLAMGCSAPRGV